MRRIERPKTGEYPAYANIYIGLLPDDGQLLKYLADNLDASLELVGSLSEEKLLFRYAQDKWTIKEILVHVMDDERIYAYRALRFARNDATELLGFEQDDFARYSAANERRLDNIVAEYKTVRAATISLFTHLPEESFLRSGVASGNRVSVRALAYHMAGHELRHMNIIKERYLV